MMVRFATTCDHSEEQGHGLLATTCGNRSPEFDAWPRCEDCGAHCCPEHMVTDSLVEADFETPASCKCLECACKKCKGNGCHQCEGD